MEKTQQAFSDTGEGLAADLRSQVDTIHAQLSEFSAKRLAHSGSAVFGTVTMMKWLNPFLLGVDIRNGGGHLKLLFKTSAAKFGPNIKIGNKIKAHGTFHIYSNGDNVFEIQFKVSTHNTYPSLFAAEFKKAFVKKPIPRYVGKIGLVTSKTSAALRDFKTALSNAIPEENQVLFPVDLLDAAKVADGIRFADGERLDALVVMRGGGSGLDVFNDGQLAASARKSKTYLISALGHEEDKLLFEEAADFRAPTPSLAGIYLRDHVLKQPKSRPIPVLTEILAAAGALFRLIRFLLRHWILTALTVTIGILYMDAIRAFIHGIFR